MSAQAGRDVLIKIKAPTGNFETAAGLRSQSLRFNAQTIDVTDSQSVQAWRELLPGGGTKSVEISGAGVFRDQASDALMRQAFFDQSHNSFQFIMPDFGIVEGPFLISALSYAGEYQGEARYEMTLLSAGAAAFTAI